MSESSAPEPDVFDGLLWSGVWVLVCVVREADYRRTEHIRARYANRATGFDAAIGFLTELGALSVAEGCIRPHAAILSLDEGEMRRWLVERMLASAGRQRLRVFRYLRSFQVADGEPMHCPPETSRHLDSHVRNFLMGMDIVRRDAKRDCYMVAPEYLALYVAAQDSGRRIAPGAVVAARDTRESLGLRAERRVVSFERDRVGRALAGQVQHVALLNAAAGYDVRSFTTDNEETILPRYIEVKAVSSSSFQFYWSRNEVSVAKRLAEWYYLYLLPVTADGRFEVDTMRIIPDPHSAVLEGGETWALESDVVRCWLPPEQLTGQRSAGDES